MINETMTAQERLQAAISLGDVDRPPIIPIIGPAAPRLAGITQAQAWQDHNVARDTFLRCFNEFGYDYAFRPNLYYPMLPGKHCAAPVRNLIPGKKRQTILPLNWTAWSLVTRNWCFRRLLSCICLSRSFAIG